MQHQHCQFCRIILHIFHQLLQIYSHVIIFSVRLNLTTPILLHSNYFFHTFCASLFFYTFVKYFSLHFLSETV